MTKTKLKTKPAARSAEPKEKSRSEHPEPEDGAYISQFELDSVMELQHVMSVLCLNLRRRLMLGAKVQPGKWTIDADLFDPEFLKQIDKLEAERVSGTNEPRSDVDISKSA